jgi:hypothetical protein
MTKIIDMTRSARLCFAAIALLLIVCPLYVHAQQCDLQSGLPPEFELYLSDGETLITDEPQTDPENQLPILFVHGHDPFNPNDEELNFRKNWFDSPTDLTSFKNTIDSNSDLGIEPYYIRFQDQGRSIVEDACDIAHAIELILKRHDTHYDPQAPESDADYDPEVPENRTNVKVVIIGYSKGAISSRLYLKSLVNPVTDLPAPSAGYQPVSEFIAIAAPNHGLIPTRNIVSLFESSTFDSSTFESSTATRQLYNGYRIPFDNDISGNRECLKFSESDAANFIVELNGHPMADSHHDATQAGLGEYPGEAPGSRDKVGTKPTDGVLYVNIYDVNDFVGGDTPPNDDEPDCRVIRHGILNSEPLKQGRKLAKNLSPHAVNKTVNVAGGDEISVHQNTVHDPVTICLALYAAVHHKEPPGPNPCNVPPPGQVPVIPPPPRASAMLALDFSGSMRSPACADSICGNAKHLVLRQAVELFVQLWRVVGVPADHLGVTYFGTQVTPVDFGGQRLVPLLECAGVID